MKHLKKIIEYDKRIGVPKFEGWEEREEKAFQDSGLTQIEYFQTI